MDIVITISIPDGATVKTGQHAAASKDEKPFVKRPDPEYPDWDPACPTHDLEWTLQPGGVSKRTGKPYNAFWKCPERGCDAKPEWKPKDDVIDEIGF